MIDTNYTLKHHKPDNKHWLCCFIFSVSSYEKNQAFTASTEWSDEDQTAPNSGNDTNGGSNPFDEDVVKGVRVRALYDYDGQEQDELSFKAGERDSQTIKSLLSLDNAVNPC